MTIENVWAIGLFEGEGSITISKKWNAVSLQLTSTDYDVIKRFAEIFGGKVYKCVKRGECKQSWNWYLSRKKDVYQLLVKILPLLGERRACKALDALDRLDKCYDNYGS